MPSDPKHANIQRIAPPQADGYAVANPQTNNDAVANPQSAAPSTPTSMPHSFEPRLILPEPAQLDDQGELDLPDDLTALAEQLQDDAAHLSSCYSSAVGNALRGVPSPAARPDHQQGATAGLPSSAPIRVALLTAAATIALALSNFLLTQQATNTDRAELPAPVHDSTTEPKPQTAHSPTVHDQLPPLDQSESLLLLGEASGPEREGLLDLLQQTAAAETSISF